MTENSEKWTFIEITGEFPRLFLGEVPAVGEVVDLVVVSRTADAIGLSMQRRPKSTDTDQDARQAVEGGADAAPEFDFAAQSAATDGGLSAEVVQTLRTPGPATGFAEKADDNG